MAPETADKGTTGAEMSSKLMPPKLGASAAAAATISPVLVQARQIGTASTSANRLNSGDGARVREPGVSRVANVTQNAGALLASVRPLV
jgi:hypothetical protein